MARFWPNFDRKSAGSVELFLAWCTGADFICSLSTNFGERRWRDTAGISGSSDFAFGRGSGTNFLDDSWDSGILCRGNYKCFASVGLAAVADFADSLRYIDGYGGEPMNNDNVFDPKNPRAERARLRRTLEKFNVLFGIGLALGFAGWFYLVLFAHVALGWLLLGVAAILLMLVVWVDRGLKHIPLGKTSNINDLLSGDTMLAMMKTTEIQPLARNLLGETKSGRFLSVRLFLTLGVLDEIFVENQAEITLTGALETARKVRERVGSKQIGGADLLVAILEKTSSAEIVLKRHHLDFEDLYACVKWFNYLYNLSKDAKKPIRSGGIARDLNFGYIPTLQHYGQNVSQRISRAARSQLAYTDRNAALEKMVQIFSGNARQNVALIGPEGSGRSLVVKAFAEELLDEDSKVPRNLKFRQIFKLDASALLSSAGGERGNLERLLTKIFNEAYAAKNIILYLNDAQLFFREGIGSVDLTNFLMPIIEAGNLRIILSIEEQEFLQLSSRKSGVANLFNRVNIAATDEAGTMRVIEDQVTVFEARFNVFYTYLAMKEAYRLGDRYINDRAEPGRALRMLEISAEYAEDGIVTEKSVQDAVETSLGVKVKIAGSHDDRERLLNMEDLIHERMVNQKSAVKLVSSALQRAAAGVRNQNRPIGTFLFLGPTGVGKTELAKAISDVYFSGESQIIRLDLNEFVESSDVNRLIADGAEDEMSLTAQVLKQPFSIVLLDEIEKAHPQVLTALLQVLDEGMLRDIKNHEVSFRDTIIVATSNAGADLVRKFVSEGQELAKVKDEITNHLIETGEFRPEFLNRFDEICVFTPLSKEDLLKVADLMIASTNKTLSTQKISVKLDEEAKKVLVEHGYDPQLGARPMRRIIQKTVENLVAKAILAGEAETGTEIAISAEDIKSELA